MATQDHRSETLAPQLSDVRRDIGNVNQKIDSISERLDALTSGLNPIPSRVNGVQSEMASYGNQLDELEHRSKLHSARMKLLQKELEYVRLENDVMLGRVDEGDEAQRSARDPYGGQQRAGGYGDGYDDRDGGGVRFAQEREGERNGRNSFNGNGGAGTQREQENGGYTPQPQQQQQQYQEPQRNNNYQQYYDADSRQYDLEAQKKEQRRKIYSSFDSTAINPQRWDRTPDTKTRFDHRANPYPGGLVFLRYHNEGFGIMKDALTRMISICRHAGGYLMGSATKFDIGVFENAPTKQNSWRVSRDQPKPGEKLMTENAITVFWFSKQKAAEEFFDNTHRNQLREPCFPTSDGYEAFFVPLLSPPPMKPYNTFLFVEILDSRKYDLGDLTQFEGEVRNDMLRLVPDCLPMIVSAREGRVVFKPGSFVSPYSKLYISRFATKDDANTVWKSGLIQGIRHRWNLHGPLNVFMFTIQEH